MSDSGALVVRARIVVLVSSACIVGWAVPAVLMLAKGFSVQDSGSYLLSYRFWRADPYFVSGSQYVYGPLFEAAGESVPFLRLVRLVMVLGCNAWFGWVFVSWLQQHQPDRPGGTRAAFVTLITACGGGMSYLWAPLTPGYYDLTAQASLVLVTLMLATLTRPDGSSWWNPLLTGVVSVALVVIKWTAAPVAMLVVGATCVVLARRERSSALTYLQLVLAGVAAALAAMDRFVIPVDRFMRVISRVSSLTAHDNHGFAHLATGYLASMVEFGVAALVLGLPLVAGYLIALRLEAAGRSRAAVAPLLAAAAVCTAVIPVLGGWHGGTSRGRLMVGVALAGLFLAVIAALASRRWSLRLRSTTAIVVAVFVAVPFLQAAGTNVPLLYVAAECAALWVAAVISVLRREQATEASLTAVATGLCVLAVATSMIAGTTTLMDPFEAGSVTSDTAAVPHLDVQVTDEAAAEYAALNRALAPYVERGRTPMFSEDATAGLIYQLGGVPLGSTWNDPGSVHRTAGILELACDNGAVDDRPPPVLFLDPNPKRPVIGALRHCGYEFPSKFQELTIPGGPPGVRVFVPGTTPSATEGADAGTLGIGMRL